MIELLKYISIVVLYALFISVGLILLTAIISTAIQGIIIKVKIYKIGKAFVKKVDKEQKDE